jgi:hypothetical protein
MRKLNLETTYAFRNRVHRITIKDEEFRGFPPIPILP